MRRAFAAVGFVLTVGFAAAYLITFDPDSSMTSWLSMVGSAVGAGSFFLFPSRDRAPAGYHFRRDGHLVRGTRGDRLAAKALKIAAGLAGEQRNMHDAWAADLLGDPDNGYVVGRWERYALVLGFVVAAIRMRLRDLARPLWHPVDWLLSKDSRTNGLIATVVGAQAIYIVDDGGIPALVTEVWEPCGILGAGLYALARWLRRVRGIELAAAPSAPPGE